MKASNFFHLKSNNLSWKTMYSSSKQKTMKKRCSDERHDVDEKEDRTGVKWYNDLFEMLRTERQSIVIRDEERVERSGVRLNERMQGAEDDQILEILVWDEIEPAIKLSDLLANEEEYSPR